MSRTAVVFAAANLESCTDLTANCLECCGKVLYRLTYQFFDIAGVVYRNSEGADVRHIRHAHLVDRAAQRGSDRRGLIRHQEYGLGEASAELDDGQPNAVELGAARDRPQDLAQ